MTTTAVVTVNVDEVKRITDDSATFKGRISLMKFNGTWEAERKSGNLVVKISTGLTSKHEGLARDHIKGIIGLLNTPLVRTQSLIVES